MIGRYGPPIFQICRGLTGAYNVALLKAKPKKHIDINYLYYFLKQDAVFQYVDKLSARTGGQTGVDLVSLNKYPICLPDDIEDQKRVASVLSNLDAKITCNKRINAELRAMVEILYDYWFVQFDFPDAKGKPYKSSGGKTVYSATLKREIPEGWLVDTLGNTTSLIRRGVSPSYDEQGGIPVLNQKCVRNQEISFLDARRHAGAMGVGDERLLQCFDVLINSTGVGTLGRVAFVKRLNEEKTTVDSHVTIVRANTKRIAPEYLAWTMLRFQPVIEAAANGSTGQVELNKVFLEELHVVIPDFMRQQRFAAFVSPIVKQMAAREKEVEQLTQLRDWLLPILMNGQATVA